MGIDPVRQSLVVIWVSLCGDGRAISHIIRYTFRLVTVFIGWEYFFVSLYEKWTRKELIYAEENLPTEETTPRTRTWFPKTHVDFRRAQGFEAPPPARAPQPGFQSQQSRQTQQLLNTACRSWQDGGIV